MFGVSELRERVDVLDAKQNEILVIMLKLTHESKNLCADVQAALEQSKRTLLIAQKVIQAPAAAE